MLSDEEIRRVLNGEALPRPAHDTLALVLMGALTAEHVGGLYSAAVNAGILLAEGNCTDMESRRACAISIVNTARAAALLEVYSLSQRVKSQQ